MKILESNMKKSFEISAIINFEWASIAQLFAADTAGENFAMPNKKPATPKKQTDKGKKKPAPKK